ncbi:hypothetical protein [Nonomuraea typhae]|uniref:hypothetical protein n=1 Tax=Nonomuraea typhae TaxID=2603600 RepID=UPI0012F9BD65|nr:hypothetical protein [Nonomuraea typhae]
MASEGILRFITVRPAKARVQPPPASSTLVPSAGLYQRLAAAVDQGATRQGLREVARHYATAADHPETLDPMALREWFYANQDRPLETADLDALVRHAYGISLPELVAGDRFAATRAQVTDRVLATAVLGDADGNGQRHVLDAKLLALAAALSAAPPRQEVTVGDMVAEAVVVLPGFLTRVRAEPVPVPPAVPAGNDDEAAAWLRRLETARDELIALVTDGRHIDHPGTLAPALPIEAVEGAEADRPFQEPRPARPRLTEEGLAGLTDGTRAVLERLGRLDGGVLPFQAVTAVEEELRRAGVQAVRPAVPSGVLAFDGGEIDLDRFRAALARPAPGTDPPPVPQHSQAGVADLLVVRQKIKAYELGEYAHVENVMAGESRERSTRRLTQVEQLTETETETETEKEKDLASTTRNELQNEAEKHVKDQLDVEAGLQVSGSYGPAASFTSSLKAGFSSTTEEAQRKASSFSQEVTQRTVEKVRERVRTLVRRRTLEEFEENNRHGFANDSLRHTRGLYRWLNKVYDAQVFTYGQRMMFDFVVPEPAAFYLYGLVENPPQDSELVKPAPPAVDGAPLTPGHIGPATYGPLLARYRVTDAPAMPAELQTVTFAEKGEGGDLANYGRSGKLTIPEGYRAWRATVQATHLFFEGRPHAFQIVVDGKMYDFTDTWGSRSDTTSWLEKEASVSISVVAASWAVAVDLDCKLSPEAYATWQHSAFDAIIAAYQQQLAEYNERKAQRELERRGNQQFGRNPLANRRVERDELKKWVVMMLTRKPDLNLDSFQAGSGQPLLDLDKANANGRLIRFLENAFEWQNMLYVFYPHLWGRRARWVQALNVTDPDPDFAAFLRAGAARVQVPVRPGFEKAVAYFAHTGNVWDGNDVPRVEDELYVPIIDEITANLGKIDGGVPYPAGSKPWEVVVPTDLVLLQDLSEVPPMRDALRPGAPVGLDAGEG